MFEYGLQSWNANTGVSHSSFVVEIPMFIKLSTNTSKPLLMLLDEVFRSDYYTALDRMDLLLCWADED